MKKIKKISVLSGALLFSTVVYAQTVEDFRGTYERVCRTNFNQVCDQASYQDEDGNTIQSTIYGEPYMKKKKY